MLRRIDFGSFPACFDPTDWLVKKTLFQFVDLEMNTGPVARVKRVLKGMEHENWKIVNFAAA